MELLQRADPLRDLENRGCRKQRCNSVTETCVWYLGRTGWDEAGVEHWAAHYLQWIQFPFLGGKR